MRVAVLGGGIVGITTAYELARAGHQVTVFEQRGTVAEEGSFAITGMRGPAHALQWAFNSTPAQFGPDFWSGAGALRRGRSLGRQGWSWIWQWLRRSKLPQDGSATQALLSLNRLSAQLLDDTALHMGWEFEQTEGCTVVLRSEAAQQNLAPAIDALKSREIAHAVLDMAAVRQLEPALNPDTPFFGGIHLAAERTANCRQVALLFKRDCDALGVEFRFDQKVEPLKIGNATTLHVRDKSGVASTLPFDSVVVCAGEGSAALVAGICPQLKLAAIHGYTLSAHIREPLNAPRHTWLDWEHRVHITRQGQRVRVGGLALIGTPSPAQRLAALRTLYKVLLDWFPGACQMQQVQEWQGTRLCTTDGLPVIGASGEAHVWLNMAHGDSGWAHACGAAAGVAGLMAGQSVEGVDWKRLSLDRFTA